MEVYGELRMRKQFWIEWGSREGQKYFNQRRYESENSYDNDGVIFHHFTFQDEDGKQIRVTFEAFKSFTTDMPIMALKMLSATRGDSQEAISLPLPLENAVFGLAMAHIAEMDKEILDEVPAW
tara:strand:- start:327 stop:695 length:369 start_codon:yes stop_codon:yes gene_type:complete